MSDSVSVSGLSVIRIVLIVGVIATGGVFWYISGRIEGPLLEIGMRSTVRLGIVGFWVALLLMVFVIRRQRARRTSAQRQRMLTVIGWALAEAIALAGVIYYLLAETVLFFVVGLLIQIVVSFVLLPIPAE